MQTPLSQWAVITSGPPSRLARNRSRAGKGESGRVAEVAGGGRGQVIGFARRQPGGGRAAKMVWCDGNDGEEENKGGEREGVKGKTSC